MYTIRDEANRRFVWKLGRLWDDFPSRTPEEALVVISQIEWYIEAWNGIDHDPEFQGSELPSDYERLLKSHYEAREDEGVLITLTSISSSEMEGSTQCAS
jgi:hypothetical protein